MEQVYKRFTVQKRRCYETEQQPPNRPAFTLQKSLWESLGQCSPCWVRLWSCPARISSPSRHWDRHPASNTTTNSTGRLHCNPRLEKGISRCSKDKLLECCREELALNQCHQLEHMLKPTSFQTVRDDSEAAGAFNRGVLHGSVTSPSLYNVFMESFPRSVTAEEPKSDYPVIMFADDVQLRSQSREGVQTMLDQAATWVVANDTTWNVANRSIICVDPNEGDYSH